MSVNFFVLGFASQAIQAALKLWGAMYSLKGRCVTTQGRKGCCDSFEII